MRLCMDWRSVKFDWNRAKAFLVTAEEGSLSAAARALGMAQPTLGRQVDALEEELGVILFERVGRGFDAHAKVASSSSITSARWEHAAVRVSLIAAGQSQSIEGTISVAASEVYAAMLLPPIIAKLRRAERRSTSRSWHRRRQAIFDGEKPTSLSETSNRASLISSHRKSATCPHDSTQAPHTSSA